MQMCIQRTFVAFQISSSRTVSSALDICFAGPLSLLPASASSDRVSLRLGGSILSCQGCMSQSAVLLGSAVLHRVHEAARKN